MAVITTTTDLKCNATIGELAIDGSRSRDFITLKLSDSRPIATIGSTGASARSAGEATCGNRPVIRLGED